METIEVLQPSINTEAYFVFKEPVASFLKDKYNFSNSRIKLVVSSVISVMDVIKIYKKDPYTTIYLPMGISEDLYKTDLDNNIALISFYFKDNKGVENYFQVPLNYIKDISEKSSIDYTERTLVVSLGLVPDELDIEPHKNDIADFIRTITGISPELKEIRLGEPVVIDPDEHKVREDIRLNNVTIRKTLTVRLKEVTQQRDDAVRKLRNIS